MYARKTASFLWPSRPASPVASAGESLPYPDASRLRPVSQPSNGVLPNRLSNVDASSMINMGGQPVAESYCSMLGLKLNEAMTKALVGGTDGPIWEKRRPVPAGKGKALGSIIVREFAGTGETAPDTFTQRAVLRTAQRPLSVLLGNLHALLASLVVSPLFTPCLPLPLTPSAPQVHALALANFARELSASLVIDDAPRFVNDGLATFRAQLDALEQRVCAPIVNSLTIILINLADGLSTPSTGAKEHQAFLPLHQSLPGIGKLLSKLLGAESGEKQEIWVAGAISAFVWRGLAALAVRPHCRSGSHSPERRASPPLTDLFTDLRPSSQLLHAPSNSRFALKQFVSRPATPQPFRPSSPSPLNRDTIAFQSTVTMLVSYLPAFSAQVPSEMLAEAVLSLSQFSSLVSLAPSPSLPPGSIPELDRLPSTLILAYLLPAGTVATLLGMDEKKFRGECLRDQGKAEEWESFVERAVSQWVAERDDWGAVRRWLLESD